MTANGGISKNEMYTGVLDEEDRDVDREVLEKIYAKEEVERTRNISTEYAWRNVFAFIILHAICVHEIYNIAFERTSTDKIFLGLFITMIVQMGVNVGAHRLWAHRSFKARLPLKLWLLFAFTVCGQNSVYEWVRDHRVHHKFTETDADPHNIKRGFFFAHMGWLLCKKHPDVKEKGKTVDMSDLESDPLIMWHHKYYPLLAPVSVLIVSPLFYSLVFSPSSKWQAVARFGVLRYMVTLHLTWLINSYSHVFGNRPYDKTIRATDSVLYSGLSLGEGWHNYHHVFPWDYKSSEWSAYGGNMSALYIDLMAWLGLAYDLKTVDPEMIKKRVIRTGDGSHPLWGWGDKDTSREHLQASVILHKRE